MPGSATHGTYAHDLGRRHPFEVAMLAAATVVGFSRILAPHPTSGSLEKALPPHLVTGWYLLLMIGSVVGLLGVSWKTPVAGLLIERSGMIFLSSAGLIYTIALISSGGWRAVAAASFVAGFATASAVRAWDIGRVLVRIRTVLLVREEVLNQEGESGE